MTRRHPNLALQFRSAAEYYRVSSARAVAASLFQISARREIAREDRLHNELCRIVGPELAHLWVGLQNSIDELSIHWCHAPNVDVQDGSSVLVEPHRSNRSVREANLVHRLEKARRVLGAATRSLERLLDDEKRGVGAGGVEAGIVLEIRIDRGDEFLVVGRIQAGSVPAGVVRADRLLAHDLQDAFVGARGIAEYRHCESGLAELPQEAQRIAPGKADVDRVHVALDLCEKRAVFERIERWPELLHDPAPGPFERQLESACAFVPIGEVFRDNRDALEPERLYGVIAERIGDLRRGAEGMQHPRIYWMTLEVDGGRRCRRDQRHFRFANISIDRQRLARCKRPDDD